mmetsp:Transcript_99939/g.312257  ORF Transcript_99939/g.312257 Transcript_99939/m.312257 type:complete len:958 (+) Transcript_99939:467-3340(+)
MRGLHLASGQVRCQLDVPGQLRRVQTLPRDLQAAQVHVLPAHVYDLHELLLLAGVVGHRQRDGLEGAAEDREHLVELSLGGQPVSLLDPVEDLRHGEEDYRGGLLRLDVTLRQQRPCQGRGLRQPRQGAARGPVDLLEERLEGRRIDDAEAAPQEAERLLELARGHEVRCKLPLLEPLRLRRVRHGHLSALGVGQLVHSRDANIWQVVEDYVEVGAPRGWFEGVLDVPRVRVPLRVLRVLLLRIHEGVAGRLARRLRLVRLLQEDVLGGHQQGPVGRVAGARPDERDRWQQEAGVGGNRRGDVVALQLLLQLGDEFLQVVRLRRQRCQRNLAHLRHDLDSLLHVPEHQCVAEPRHDVVPLERDRQHQVQLREVPRDEVEEGQGVIVLRLLVHLLDDDLVPLAQSLQTQAVPARMVVKLVGRCHGLLNVAVLEREVEARLLVLHELQGHLREALSLQVADDRVAAKPPIGDLHFHVIELPVVQGKLEEVLRAVEPLLVHVLLAVDVVHELLVHADDVDGALQGVDDAVVAVWQAVLHVAQRGVDEDAVLVPGAALHADVLVEGVAVLQVLSGHQHVVLGHARHILAILRPDHVADAPGNNGLFDDLAAREVPHHDLLLALQQDPIVAAGEDEVRGHRRLELLGELVLQVVDADRTAVLEDGKPVPGRERHGLGVALLGGNVGLARGTVRADKEVIAAIVLCIEDEAVGLRRVVRVELQGLHARDHRVRGPPAGGHVVALQALLHVDHVEVPLLHHVEVVAEALRQGPLAVELEDDHARVVAHGDEVRGGVRGDDPAAVVLAAEGVDARSLRGVPDPDRAVLRVGQHQLLPGVEDHAGDVVEVASQGVDLPSLRVVHPPELDEAVIGPRDYERQRGVEGRPVDALVVAFKHVLHNGIGRAEDVLRRLPVRGRRTGADGDGLVAEAGGVPHAHGLVEGGRNHEVLLRVEVSAHDIVIVPS